jgi:hypothetical protein
MAWKLRGCPHCGGDISLDEDMNKNRIENCLQCGYEAVLKTCDWQLLVFKPVDELNAREPKQS